jgi:lipopolysaccharide biosynthesis glycosyltransferase
VRGYNPLTQSNLQYRGAEEALSCEENNHVMGGPTRNIEIEMPVIHLAVAFDKNYLVPVYALITSIFSHNNPAKIHFHAIVTGITNEELDQLTTYVRKSGAYISYYSIDETFVKKFVLINKWTSAVYYRLFFPLLVPPGIDRLLYLDTDTIVVNNLAELFQTPLENFPMGAVYDIYVKNQPLLNIHEEGEYFNSGVLLIDVYKWREQKISEKAINYLIEHSEKILYVDQCALNAILYSNWKKLPSKFNLIYSFVPDGLSKKQIERYVKDKVVIHYTLQRPWSMLCRNRLDYLYYYYLKRSPLGKTIKRYTDFKWAKVPNFLKIKLFHLYLDLPGLPGFWRKLKNSHS